MTSSRKRIVTPAKITLPGTGRKGTTIASAPLNHVHEAPVDSLEGHLAAEDPHDQYYNEDRGNATFAPIAKGVTNGDNHDHVGGDGAQIDHGGTAGLSDDDHTQYALLAGRSGGQTLKGGTASGDDLTIVSTNHTTKGDVYLGGDGATNRTTIESDGTVRFDGDATTWADMQFQISSGKVGAANNPNWEAFTTNTYGYSFDVNDYIDLGANETHHGWKEGTNGAVHLHLAIKTAQSTGADRFAKFTIYLAYADVNEVWTETSLTAEYTIPTGTAALTHKKLDMGTLTLTNNLFGTQIKPRITRIAATGGTEYADSVFINQVGIHLEHDTVGSRQSSSK